MNSTSTHHNPVLMVRQHTGRYQPASDDQILQCARTVIEARMARGMLCNCPREVGEHLAGRLGMLEHEQFTVLYLDNQHRLIECVDMFRGDLASATVSPREIVKEALRFNAAAVILAHNHPSGHPEPSSDDRRLTQELKRILGIVDIRVLDHIVVGGTATVSMAERGLL